MQKIAAVEKNEFGGRFSEGNFLFLSLRIFFGGYVIFYLGAFLVHSTDLGDASSQAVKLLFQETSYTVFSYSVKKYKTKYWDNLGVGLF